MVMGETTSLLHHVSQLMTQPMIQNILWSIQAAVQAELAKRARYIFSAELLVDFPRSPRLFFLAHNKMESSSLLLALVISMVMDFPM